MNRNNLPDSKKKLYSVPELIEYGPMAKLTHDEAAGSFDDGALEPNSRSGGYT